MITSVEKILKAIDGMLPFHTMDQWDNSGLIIGRSTREVHRILLCLDVTDEVIQEAIDDGADLIISHHPIIFKGLKTLTSKDAIVKKILQLIENDIAVISTHTNLDKSFDLGINQFIASNLHLEKVELLVTEGEGQGHGVIGYLHTEKQAIDLIQDLKSLYHIQTLQAINYQPHKMIKKIAICSGASADFIADALKAHADVFITSDLKYHESQSVLGTHLTLIDVGHFESEFIFLESYKNLLSTLFSHKNYDVFVKVTESEKPIRYFL